MTRADLAASCDDVTKTYRTATGAVVALADVGADFPRGAVTAVVGPSGSGKSSLLRLLACVDRPDRGQIRVGAHEVSAYGARARRKVRRREVGYVFQNPADNLLDYLTATEHLAFCARLRGRADANEPARLLEALGLAHRRDHLPRQLSGGEQQRLAVACAVAGRPAVVVADEPTAQLDHVSGEKVLAAILRLRDEGVGFVVSSHDPVVRSAADHVVNIVHGRVEEAW